mmetsp:Transcript_17753/g.20451  ORF Transcript_17753/g.20451 Transcript_17753/m.20451 type:complete len:217 (-) Transcript_17753:1466-2116(-)
MKRKTQFQRKRRKRLQRKRKRLLRKGRKHIPRKGRKRLQRKRRKHLQKKQRNLHRKRKIFENQRRENTLETKMGMKISGFEPKNGLHHGLVKIRQKMLLSLFVPGKTGQKPRNGAASLWSFQKSKKKRSEKKYINGFVVASQNMHVQIHMKDRFESGTKNLRKKCHLLESLIKLVSQGLREQRNKFGLRENPTFYSSSCIKKMLILARQPGILLEI